MNSTGPTVRAGTNSNKTGKCIWQTNIQMLRAAEGSNDSLNCQ